VETPASRATELKVIGSPALATSRRATVARFITLSCLALAARTRCSAITRILPPTSGFSGNNNHAAKKQTVLDKLLAFLDRYFRTELTGAHTSLPETDLFRIQLWCREPRTRAPVGRAEGGGRHRRPSCRHRRGPAAVGRHRRTHAVPDRQTAVRQVVRTVEHLLARPPPQVPRVRTQAAEQEHPVAARLGPAVVPNRDHRRIPNNGAEKPRQRVRQCP
jgi:hypothetical protein